jgi:hypothetical protein
VVCKDVVAVTAQERGLHIAAAYMNTYKGNNLII